MIAHASAADARGDFMRRLFRIVSEAFDHFNNDDAWAIASHIALSILMAMFPFFIVLTSIASLFDFRNLADEVAKFLLATWPEEIAKPIALEIHNVLTTSHTGVLTVGAVLAVFFASSGVEALRIGLNRAYGETELRHWFVLRLESIFYVLVAAIAMLALGILIVLGPLLFGAAVQFAPWLQEIEGTFNLVRFGVAGAVLIIALLVVHKWLPAGRRRFVDILPGVLATLVLWLAAGVAFGRYLAQYSSSYVTYYAGLASVMMALVFLYWSASIFIFGGELNSALSRYIRAANKEKAEHEHRHREHHKHR
jgi:membrane protein